MTTPSIDLIDRDELAQRLGVCRHTLYEYERRGLLRPIYLTKRTVRYNRAEVERMLERLTVQGGVR